FQPPPTAGITIHWRVVRNLKLWSGTYTMSPEAVKDGNAQSYIMPEDGNHIALPSNETFGIISRSALKDLKKNGKFLYNSVLWQKTGDIDSPFGKAIQVEDPEEGAKMTILDNPDLPLILSMSDNPLEINWTFSQ
ncbi:MAG: hypothetical protein K2I08_00075, partial [Muribaculaceae bacterium]|nr:hypothetical protein [Muribaculaceae bacterium]